MGALDSERLKHPSNLTSGDCSLISCPERASRAASGLDYLREIVPVVKHVDEAEDEDGSHVNGERDQEHEEVAVIPPADAVVHPRAVVIEDLEDGKEKRKELSKK